MRDDATWKTSEFWTETEAAAAVAAWKRSGLPMAVFCREHGLGRTRLQPWVRRQREATTTARGQRRRVPRAVAVTVVDRSAAMFEVVLGSGTVVRVGRGFDDAELRRLLAAVVQSGC